MSLRDKLKWKFFNKGAISIDIKSLLYIDIY